METEWSFGIKADALEDLKRAVLTMILIEQWSKGGIRVVGKGSLEKREVGKFKVGESDMKLERIKLECLV